MLACALQRLCCPAHPTARTTSFCACTILLDAILPVPLNTVPPVPQGMLMYFSPMKREAELETWAREDERLAAKAGVGGLDLVRA